MASFKFVTLALVFNLATFSRAADSDVVARLRRSSPPTRQLNNCRFTLEEVTAVTDVLSNYMKGQFADQNALQKIADSQPDSNATPCQQAMQEIKRTSAKLITINNQFQRMSSSAVSGEEYNKLKLLLKETNKNLQEQMEQVRLQASQEAKEKIDQVTRDKQTMKQQMDEALEKLEREIVEHQQDILALAASEIDSDHIDSAVKKFKKLRDNTLIADIIKKAYKTQNILRILKFINELDWLIHRTKGVLALINEINDHNDLGSPLLLVIETYVKKLKAVNNVDSVVAESKPVFEEIEQKMRPCIKTVVNNMALGVTSGNNQHLVQFAKDHGELFVTYLDTIVAEAYSPNEATELAILQFSNDLTKISHSAMVYIELYKQMKRADHMAMTPVLRMAIKVRELMVMPNYVNIASEVQSKMSVLWDKFPSVFQAIVKGDSVCIKNDGFSYYYHLVASYHYDSERDIVVATETIKSDVVSSKWKFETKSDGKIFMIKTDNNNDYFYAAGDDFAYNSSKRKVFTWRSSTQVIQGDWELQDSDWKNNKFYLYNTHYREYLNGGKDYTTFLNRQWENAYTWREGGRGPTPVWKIDAC